MDIFAESIIEKNYLFSRDIYGTIAKEEPARNVFISPLSISLSLAMVLVGADGNTRKELLSVLGPSGDSDENFHRANKEIVESLSTKHAEHVAISNKLFIEEKHNLVQAFLTVVKNSYNASCSTTPFATDVNKAAQDINSWANEATKGKISTLVAASDLDPQTALLIANAVYFKSSWANRFDPDQTTDEDFTLLNGEIIKVSMMCQKKKFKYCHLEDLQCDVLELPYKDENLKMMIFLPVELNGLHLIEHGFNLDLVKRVQNESRLVKLDVWLPSFKIEASYKLGPVLKELGVSDAFISGVADFSKITGNRDLYVREVIHKTFVEVNEEGTEAAAVTGVMMTKRSIEFPVPFRADHPFLFAIMEATSNNLLFFGSLKSPVEVKVAHSEL